VVVPILVRVDRPNLSLLRGADYLGMTLMALFLGCLEYTLEEGPRWDWFGDDTIRLTAWISGISAIAFIWRSLTHSQPVVDLRALTSRNFALGCFFSFVTGIGIFATIYLTPLFLGRVLVSARCRSASLCAPPAHSRSARSRFTPSWRAASICAG
jgi:MFS transporter, DHA2 family, multidrug resistance protein